MLWALLAFLITFALVWLAKLAIPLGCAPYVAIALVAGFDSVVGGWRASLEGKYDSGIFVTGFFVNAAAASLFAYIGDAIGIGFSLIPAVAVPFAIRIFTNLGYIRRYLLQRWRASKGV